VSRLLTGLGVLAVLVASMTFAGLNGGQRVTLRLGFTTFYRVPLSVVAFGALILGMVIMLLAGISSDLRVRRILRERLLQEDMEERSRMFVDRAQTSLFDDDEEITDEG
jgi:uncharacterized integral membrane protein